MQFKDKLFINIGGTSRSGSTLLSKILANDDKALNLGEIRSVFFPTRIHHKVEIEKIINSKGVWSDIIKEKMGKLPKNIFDSFPDVYFLVDSSKNPFWIKKINANSKDQSIKSKNILIYKDPEDFAYSILKRGQKNWEKQYVDYHKKYFSSIKDFYIISYTSLVKNKKTLHNLCDWLGIEDFEGKYDYWKDEKHSGFFGSNTPKDKRNVEYNKAIPVEFISSINTIIDGSKELKEIWSFLKENENKVVHNVSTLNYSKARLFFLKKKNELNLIYRNFNPENYFKKQ